MRATSATKHTWVRLSGLGVVLAFVGACGGGGGADSSVTIASGAPRPAPSSNPTQVPSPAPSPSPAQIPTTTTPPPAPSGARILHFADCQAGAVADCMPGDNASPGTEAAPKRDLNGVDLNALPAGSQVLFKRGGSWSTGRLVIENPNVRADAPLVFDAYGTGVAPVLRASGINLFEFGRWQSTLNDGGYWIRNLRLDGGSDGLYAVWLRDFVHDVTVDNVEITGFDIGLHWQGEVAPGISGVAVRNSFIHRNREHGIHGKATGALVEGNLIEANNPSGSNFNHGVYLSGGSDIAIRNNRFLRNSVGPDGWCRGGNLTVHGQIERLTVESNWIEQDRASGSCYAISITAGYLLPEWFRETAVRGNTVVNSGICAVCASSAPGIVVENNRFFNTQSAALTGVQIPASGGGESAGDDPDRDAIVRNNTLCQTSTSLLGSLLSFVTASGSQIYGNVLRLGNDASSGICVR